MKKKLIETQQKQVFDHAKKRKRNQSSSKNMNVPFSQAQMFTFKPLARKTDFIHSNKISMNHWFGIFVLFCSHCIEAYRLTQETRHVTPADKKYILLCKNNSVLSLAKHPGITKRTKS